MTFAREGWPFVLPFVALAALLLWLGHPAWSATALVVGFLVLLFFRNPHRSFDGDAGTVLAAADGLVTGVEEIDALAVGPGRHRRVITFLSVFDIHVQRVPVAGEVIASSYRAGRKVAACSNAPRLARRDDRPDHGARRHGRRRGHRLHVRDPRW